MRRGTVAVLPLLAVTLLLPLVQGAQAGHGPTAPGGPYSGYAHGTTVHVDALTVGTTRVANVDVGLSNAVVNSQGIAQVTNAYKRDVATAQAAKHSLGKSSVADVGLVSAPNANPQIAPAVGEAAAPPAARVDKAILDSAVATVLDVDVARNVADAAWNDDTCVLGRPISFAEEHLARVEVLETGDDPATPPTGGFDKPLIGVDTNQQGPPRASSATKTTEELFWPGSGTTFGLRSLVHTTLAPVTLFQGTANEFTVEVDGPAFLDVRATGKPGGAVATFNAPIVTIYRGATVLAKIPSAPVAPIAIPSSTAGDVIAEVKIGVMEPIPATRAPFGMPATAHPDGTKAAAQASVVQVRLLDIASSNFTGATIALGHMEAATTVPSGGVTCPIPVQKSLNRRTVTVNETFTATITVFNRFACPLTGVVLTDDINVKNTATRFRIKNTTPAAREAPTGTSPLSTAKVVWGLGTIPPGESRSVTIELEALGNAGIIEDIATATGTLSDCPAGPGGDNASVLAKVNIPVAGLARAEIPVTAGLIPRTGATNAAVAGLGLVAIAVAVRRMTFARR